MSPIFLLPLIAAELFSTPQLSADDMLQRAGVGIYSPRLQADQYSDPGRYRVTLPPTNGDTQYRRKAPTEHNPHHHHQRLAQPKRFFSRGLEN